MALSFLPQESRTAATDRSDEMASPGPPERQMRHSTDTRRRASLHTAQLQVRFVFDTSSAPFYACPAGVHDAGLLRQERDADPHPVVTLPRTAPVSAVVRQAPRRVFGRLSRHDNWTRNARPPTREATTLTGPGLPQDDTQPAVHVLIVEGELERETSIRPTGNLGRSGSVVASDCPFGDGHGAGSGPRDPNEDTITGHLTLAPLSTTLLR